MFKRYYDFRMTENTRIFLKSLRKKSADENYTKQKKGGNVCMCVPCLRTDRRRSYFFCRKKPVTLHIMSPFFRRIFRRPTHPFLSVFFRKPPYLMPAGAVVRGRRREKDGNGLWEFLDLPLRIDVLWMSGRRMM